MQTAVWRPEGSVPPRAPARWAATRASSLGGHASPLAVRPRAPGRWAPARPRSCCRLPRRLVATAPFAQFLVVYHAAWCHARCFGRRRGPAGTWSGAAPFSPSSTGTLPHDLDKVRRCAAPAPEPGCVPAPEPRRGRGFARQVHEPCASRASGRGAAGARARLRASARATPRPRIRTSSARATAHVASPHHTTKPGGPPPRPREGARRRHAVRRAQVSGRSPRVRTHAACQRPSRAECTLGWDASGVGRNPGHCSASNRAKSGRRRVGARPARLASSPAREGLAVHMTCDVGGQRADGGKTAERVSGLGPPAGGRDRGRFT